MEAALSLVQMQAAAASSLAVWVLTLGVQPARGVSSAAHAGAWGLARSARAEASPPLGCIDGLIGRAFLKLSYSMVTLGSEYLQYAL